MEVEATHHILPQVAAMVEKMKGLVERVPYSDKAILHERWDESKRWPIIPTHRRRKLCVSEFDKVCGSDIEASSLSFGKLMFVDNIEVFVKILSIPI